jgi:hypothetical protein
MINSAQRRKEHRGTQRKKTTPSFLRRRESITKKNTFNNEIPAYAGMTYYK